MSINQWLVLLCIFLGYILFGATVFYLIESKEEETRLEEEVKQRHIIEDLIKRNYVLEEGDHQDDIFHKISDYCDKPLGGNVPHKKSQLNWTFYHSIFFVMTVISTIGYGNLSPTTVFTRTFIIIYGIIGIPINGIVVISIGDYFGRTFLRLYKRWKNVRIHRALATLGLIGQIILYAIPGFTLLILIPSLIIVLYENWTYDLAIEFAFATLTTIGVGHLVPGTTDQEHGVFLFIIYKTFLMLWIIVGLGYLAMVFSFISRGLRSKKMHKLEHKIARNIKKTNRKIRQELRSLLNEYLLMGVKPIYRERRLNAPMKCLRTQSCPDLSFVNDFGNCKIRKRAFSELPKPCSNILSRRQSDTDLQNIDRERTFVVDQNAHEHNQLLLRVVNALSNYNTMACSTTCTSDETDTYFDFENDRYESQWSNDKEFPAIPTEPMRPRAASESVKERVAKIFPWSQLTATRRAQEMREKEKYGKARSRTLPPIAESQNIVTRLKNTFKNHKPCDVESQYNEIESNGGYQEGPQRSETPPTDKNPNYLLEETTLADFLRALTIINFREVSKPRRKFGTCDQSLTPRIRRLPITPVLTARKTSLLAPASPLQEAKQRRFSLNSILGTNTERVDISPPLSPLVNKATVSASNRITIQTHKATVGSSIVQSIHRQRLKSLSKIMDNKHKND